MKLFFKLAIICTLFGSCTVNSNFMLKTKLDYVFDELDYEENPEYKISTNDVIDFRLYTNDGFQIIDMVSTGKGSSQANMNMINANMMKYFIRQDSLVELPIIGEVNLLGKTIKEAELYLEELFSEYYVDPFIYLRVDSRRVFIFKGGGNASVLPLTYNNTTLIEALASGLPSISSSVGIIPDYIIHNVNGLLIQPNNKLNLEKTIEKTINDINLREKLSKNGVNLAESIFSEDISLKKLSEIIKQLSYV